MTFGSRFFILYSDQAITMTRTWTAKCWLGSESGYVDLTTQAGTSNGARAQFENIYGAEQVVNLREVSNSLGDGTNFGNIGGYAALFAGLFVVWLFIEFWYLAIPLSVLGGIIWWQSRND